LFLFFVFLFFLGGIGWVSTLYQSITNVSWVFPFSQ
jgi:hypothetical protein